MHALQFYTLSKAAQTDARARDGVCLLEWPFQGGKQGQAARSSKEKHLCSHDVLLGAAFACARGYPGRHAGDVGA